MNRQLATVQCEEAKRRWRENLPMTLKQLAVALEVGYDVPRKWSRMDGFPFADGLVFPRLFEAWNRSRFAPPARKSPKKAPAAVPEDRRPTAADKPGESASRRDSRAALPPRAARLLERAS